MVDGIVLPTLWSQPDGMVFPQQKIRATGGSESQLGLVQDLRVGRQTAGPLWGGGPRGPLGSVLFGQEIRECKGSKSGTKWAVDILEMTVVDTQFSPKSCWAKLSWAVASFAISCHTPISPNFTFLAQHPRIDHYTLVRSLIWMVDSAFFSIFDAQQFF